VEHIAPARTSGGFPRARTGRPGAIERGSQVGTLEAVLLRLILHHSSKAGKLLTFAGVTAKAMQPTHYVVACTSHLGLGLGGVVFLN
jgi:hypothetical protein